MARNITVTFEDGATHVYENAPDNLTPDMVSARAQKDFGKTVVALDGGRAALPTTAPSAEGMPTGRTASTQEGTMGAYSPRRAPPPPPKLPSMFTTAPEPVAEAQGAMAAFRGLSSSILGIPGSVTGMFNPNRTEAESVQDATPENIRKLYAKLGSPEPTTEELKAAQFGGEIFPALAAGATLVKPAINYIGPKVGKMASSVADVLAPSRLKTTGLAEVLNNDPVLMGRVKTLLEQGKTIDQAAAIVGSPGLATFAQTARNASPATQMLYNDLAAALKASQENKLATAAANVNALAQRNLPVATASPTAPRRAVKQALAGEAAALEGQKTALTGQLTAQQQAAEAALAAQRQGVEGGIANVSQLETGRALAKANEEILRNTQRTVTGPAYQAAFDAAPEATINLTGVAGVAKEQRGELLTQLKGLAPNSAALLERYGPKQVEAIIQGVPVKQTIPPAPITLEEAHAIRQAINIDRAALKGSNESGANITRARLNELYDSVNAAISRDVAPEAKALFEDANTLFKERIVGVHRTGQPSNLTRTSTLNEPMLRPGDIVSKAMADEGSTLQFLNVFKQDAAAMQNLKTGVEDLYRQQVLSGGKAATPQAHAKFIADNAKQLGALDSAGMGMTTRLNQIGGQIKGLTAAEETLAAQGKAIPSKVAETFKAEDEALNLASTTLGFKQTDKLRSAIVSNPETASQALVRMDAPAKSSLARGVMQDAGKASDPLKHLVDNEQGIMRVLNANDPKTAKATFNAAKDAAELLKIIEQTGNKLGVKAPANAMVSQQNLANLTQGLPQVRAVVKDIQTQLAQGETFETLAAQGKLGKNSALKLFREETTPHVFPLNKVWSVANMILGRLEGRIDKKLAVEIATELANPATAAAAVGKAQAKQLGVGTTTKAVTNLIPNTPPIAAVNALSNQ
jgi:hypothetical protein